MNIRKRKILIILTSFVLLITLLFSIVIVSSVIYTRKNIDFNLDEQLFQTNQTGNITTLYYNAAVNESIYSPEVLCTLTPSGSKKQWFSYGEIGDNLKNGFISAEDRDFFKHKGVNFKRTVYALANYMFSSNKKSFGASTITQQVIKNISGKDEKTVRRKITEIIRSLHIENMHTKEEIFEVYMNIVPMGEGIAGVGLAAEYYFGKEPSELTCAEAATLVGITNAPGKYNPHKSPEECKKKRNNVLFAMLDNNMISHDEYERAIKTELIVLAERDLTAPINSWLSETVIDDVVKELAEKRGISESVSRHLVMNGGLKIYTTASPKIQEVLENYFENINNFPKDVKNGLNYSMVITDSKSGNLLGIVGGVGKKDANRILNYAITPNTPGSSLKPLALYAPLIDKKKINWASVFDDVPVSFKKLDNGEYSVYPNNYPKIYDGLTTVSDALRFSKNTVALRLYNMSDAEKIFSSLHDDFGFFTMIKRKEKNGRIITDLAASPLALGQLSYGVSLRALTEAYTVFPKDGLYERGKSFLTVSDSKGNIILDNTDVHEKQIYSKECARIMNQLMMRVVESGTAKAVTLRNMVDTAGKTGTSGNDKDRLFIGYTPYITAGIWCGFTNKDSSIGKQNVSHLEIWDDIMKEIHEIILNGEENVKTFPVDGLKYLPYCKDSGGLFSDVCIHDPRGERLEYGYFTEDNKPKSVCLRHVLCYYDDFTKGMACNGCPKENLKPVALIDIPDRKFPQEIIITDAEYVWRKTEDKDRLGDSYDIPYFYYILEEDEFVGRSKNKKQYNSSCYIHD